MGGHLTYEEKLNAETELQENKAKIKLLRAEINTLKYKNHRQRVCDVDTKLRNVARISLLKVQIKMLLQRDRRLTHYLKYREASKHNGLYGIDGDCFKMFGKRFRALTAEERRKYNRIKTQESRERAKKKA